MILTLYYVAATCLQWYRLGRMKTKLTESLNLCSSSSTPVQTLSDQGTSPFKVSSLKDEIIEVPPLISKGVVFFTGQYNLTCTQTLGDLLCYQDDRRACTVIPQKCIDLSEWIAFPRGETHFPLVVSDMFEVRPYGRGSSSPMVYILLQADISRVANLDDLDTVQIEQLGTPIAWRTDAQMSLVIRCELQSLIRLATMYMAHPVAINDRLKLLQIETVAIVGKPYELRSKDILPGLEWTRNSSCTRQWSSYIMQLRSLCSFAKRRVREEYRKIDKLSHLKKDKTYILSRHRNKEKYLENDTSKLETNLQIIPSVHAIIPSVQKQELSNYLIESIEKIDPALRPTDLNVKPDTKKKFSRIEKYEGKLKKYLSPHRKLASDKNKSKPKDYLNIHGDASPKSDSPSPKHESTTKRSIFCLKKRSKDKEAKKVVETQVEETTVIVKANSSEVISSGRSVTSSLSANRILDLSPTNDVPIRQISTNSSTLMLPEINLNNKKIEEVLQEKVIMKDSNSKPPNILVYADSTITRENVRKVLCRLLSKDKYTVYSVSSTKAWWGSQATLLVVCGSVSSQLNQLMLDYLLSGGQMLCLCSDFINTVLPTFTTAEVRERELVCFSYERWHRVRMIHHIFCYQPSPGRKLFSKDSSEEVSPSSSRSTMVSAVDIKDTRGNSHTLHVSVLGTEDTWHTPSLLLAEVPASNGKAVFSQVHLELEPNQYEEDESIYSALTESDPARLGILKHLLENYLNIECGNSDRDVVYTPAYFLGLHELKLAMLSQLSTKLCGDVINASKLQIQFYRKGTEPKVPTESFLPVLIHSCPERFSTVEYFDTIRTNQIGRLLIYSDILTSSMDVLDGCSLTHGLVVVSRQQTHGVGRSKNVWLSPEGCCMFSVQLHVPAASELGRRAPLVQILVAVSIVSAIKSLPGYEALNIGLKWPNDIYVKGSVKIGGLIIKSVVDSSRIVCNVGVGINLDNSAPTTCINDLINEYNHMNSVNLKTLTLECFMASIFNELERIYTKVVNGDLDYLYDKYYLYWLHGNKEINVVTADGNSQQVTVEGIDDYGFLRVKNKDVTFTVHPDGNSFDMMVGLITPKTPTP